jgi:hypothetical protein
MEALPANGGLRGDMVSLPRFACAVHGGEIVVLVWLPKRLSTDWRDPVSSRRLYLYCRLSL